MTSMMLAKAKQELKTVSNSASAGLGVTLGDAYTRTEPYVEINEDGGVCHVYWGGYDYQIPLDELQNPMQVLGWIQQMGEKTWQLMTPERIALFVTIKPAGIAGPLAEHGQKSGSYR